LEWGWELSDTAATESNCAVFSFLLPYTARRTVHGGAGERIGDALRCVYFIYFSCFVLIEEKNERKMGRKKISGWNFSDLEGQKWKSEVSEKWKV
jgi:hypothetical protein